ncbi:MAG: hypothetical protein H0X29_10365 [Parachlamydiaceae bacterium]|nr:hypothetical protein [Parachlamydiaceae bacterium]
MESKIPLTNEKVRKKFKSQFDLVNYAIKLAENMIRTGRDCRVKIDSQNRALQILTEIIHDKDQFDEIPVEEVVAVEEIRRPERHDRFDRSERIEREHNDRPEEGRRFSKSGDRKKPRKILAD